MGYRLIGFLVIPFILFFLSCTDKKADTTLVHKKDTLKSIKSDTKMVYIKGGDYVPFYGTNNKTVAVSSFLIDEKPVTNREYLEFLKSNPQWRKSQVKRIFADTLYLKNWISDLQIPEKYNPKAPVCNVSWFAAKAYAECVGKRLPTLDEWEYMAMADEHDYNARDKKSYSDNIVNLYLIKDKQFNSVKQSKPNVWGVYNVFDLIWEWSDDFNSVLMTGDSREGQNDDKKLFCAAGATSATDVLNYAAFMRFGLRSSLKANYTVGNLGFRCAKDTIITQ